jgi:hypothetical protein
MYTFMARFLLNQYGRRRLVPRCGADLSDISKRVVTKAAEKLVLKFEGLIVVLLSGKLVYTLDCPMLGVGEYRTKKDRRCRQWLRLGALVLFSV